MSKRNLNVNQAEEIRAVAKRTLLIILEPISEFVKDSGLSTADLEELCREAAVRVAATKQLADTGRVNISGIAATTGIGRAVIARVLKTSVQKDVIRRTPQPLSTNRVLAAWHADPQFTNEDGKPADLRLYGQGSTFETLSQKYGRGIPTRALLDELGKSNAVELLANQRIRAKTTVAIERGMSLSAIKTFGERAAELLATMLFNMRKPVTARFVSGVSDAEIPLDSLPLLRRQISDKGADLLSSLQEDLIGTHRRVQQGARKKPNGSRVSVTIFYHESSKDMTKGQLRRKNYRRKT